MQHPLQANAKKAWTAPKLTVHGNVEKITQKKWGYNDGYITTIDVEGPIDGTITGPIDGGTKGTDPKAKPSDFVFTPKFS